MFRIDTSSAVPNQPAIPAVGTPGWFAQPSAGTGIAPTEMSPEWANTVQAEIENVILAAGIVLNKGDQRQLLQALQALLNPYQSSIGFTPVQQGGGSYLKNGVTTYQGGNKIYVGYDFDLEKVTLQVDDNNHDFGPLATETWSRTVFQPLLGYVPVSQGGSVGSPKTAQIFLDWHEQSLVPVFQQNRNDGSPPIAVDLATVAYVVGNYVQQGGGSYHDPSGLSTNQSSSKIYIGYDPTRGKLTAQIDGNNTQFGPIAFENWTSNYVLANAASRFAFSSGVQKSTFFGIYQPGPVFSKTVYLACPENYSVWVNATAVANVGGNGSQPPTGNNATTPQFNLAISVPDNTQGYQTGDITDAGMTLTGAVLITNRSTTGDLVISVTATYQIPAMGQNVSYADVSISLMASIFASGPAS